MPSIDMWISQLQQALAQGRDVKLPFDDRERGLSSAYHLARLLELHGIDTREMVKTCGEDGEA